MYDISIPFDAVQLSLFLLRLRESQQILPYSDAVMSKLESSSPLEVADDGGRDARVVLLTDPDCPDSDTWSGWMRNKQHFDVPCSYTDSGPIVRPVKGTPNLAGLENYL